MSQNDNGSEYKWTSRDDEIVGGWRRDEPGSSRWPAGLVVAGAVGVAASAAVFTVIAAEIVAWLGWFYFAVPAVAGAAAMYAACKVAVRR
jgi:hypothetical protein